MSLRGLPDFHQPIIEDGLEIYYPYEGGKYVLVPDQLEVAERNDGAPDFLLELVRGQDPSLPPKPYGVLDFRVRPRYRMKEALIGLRERHPKAMLGYAVFSTGFLRLYPRGGDTNDIPADLLEPIALVWNGLDTTRLTYRLSTHAATLVKGALQNQVVILGARAEMEMIGVSTRLPLRVRFDPAELLGALVSLSSEDTLVSRDDIVNFFRNNLSDLPLKVAGQIDNRDQKEFAQTMTDWVRVRFGTFVASPRNVEGLYLSLISPDDIGSGHFEWDLSEPLRVARPLSLTLDPFESAYQIAQNGRLDRVFRETTVPSIPIGMHSIEISANLPLHRQGILALGVTLRAAPRPPHRFQAIVKTVELLPPEDTASVLLRLSPIEPLEFTFSTFIVLKTPGGITRLEGDELSHHGNRIRLNVSYFPVEFAPVEASRALLTLAAIKGTFSWFEDGVSMALPFELREGQATISLAIPAGSADFSFAIEAQSREGLGSLHLDSIRAKMLSLDLHSFPEYGPQKIKIVCVFQGSTGFAAIELLPEDRSDTPEEITVLHFTPAQPIKEWRWFAASPFKPGYRYRHHSTSDKEPMGWSEPQSPYSGLTINAGQQ